MAKRFISILFGALCAYSVLASNHAGQNALYLSLDTQYIDSSDFTIDEAEVTARALKKRYYHPTSTQRT